MIGYENGVHGGVVSTIETLTEPGDAVLINSPSYVGFLGDLKSSGRKTVLSPLVKDGDGTWQDGSQFAWKDAIRLNVALPMSKLKEAMERLSRYVF